jgi:hypothetical protein
VNTWNYLYDHENRLISIRKKGAVLNKLMKNWKSVKA